MAARAMSWGPFLLLSPVPHVPAFGQSSITLLRFSQRACGIGGCGFMWSVNLSPSWWYCAEGPLSSVRVGFCGFLWPDFLLLVYRISLDTSSLDAFGPSRVEFLGYLIPAYARWCLLSLSSWCRSFACGDPGRLSGLNNARLVDAGVLVCWHDCLFLWVDAQDVISELFLVELILKEWIIGEANITWFQLSL
ncbi:hypothetical protein Bca4012_089755 [Brassica carinata]